VLSVLARRFPSIPVLVYPVPVQGAGAAPAIVRALEMAGRRADCDVLILTRGGGSLEDLWAFNEESVARAVAECPLPVVSGVGHEVDFTIADFAADHRAATPSAAAEVVSPDAREWRARRDGATRRLQILTQGRLREERQTLAWLLRRLRHPRRYLLDLRRRESDLRARLRRALEARLAAVRQRTLTANARLSPYRPATRIDEQRRRTRELDARLQRAWSGRLERHRQSLAALRRALETVSPQRTLERGYAIVTRDADGVLLQDPAQAAPGDPVTARLAHGVLPLTVREQDDAS
jgi:exodeoxyribonuclease VII large subunit